MSQECEKFTGRLREICEGSADLPLYKINAYRQRWGLEPLPGDDSVRLVQPKLPRAEKVVHQRPAVAEQKREPAKPVKRGCCGGRKMQTPIPRPNGYGPGSQLLKLWTGMPHCDACLALAGQMDAWGPDGCTQRLDQIVADILPRAQAWMKQNHPWVRTLLAGTSTEGIVLKMGIGRNVRRAVEESRNVVSEWARLAAIVPYFNFSRSKTREHNLLRCLDRLRKQGFDVFTVEAVLDGQAFLLPGGPRSMRFTLDSPLYARESMVNACILSLPPEYKAVAWLDADVLFGRPDIVQATLAALHEWPVVQMFSTVRWLDPRGRLDRTVSRTTDGSAYQHSDNGGRYRSRGDWTGFAWAARRHVLNEVGGLYDGYPAGSCDVLASTAFHGDPDDECFDAYPESVLVDYRTWQDKVKSVVKGRVGYVDATVTHLYHGEHADRQYRDRHLAVKDAGFERRHLEMRPDGMPRLSSDCPPAVVDYMTKYLTRLRREP